MFLITRYRQIYLKTKNYSDFMHSDVFVVVMYAKLSSGKD